MSQILQPHESITEQIPILDHGFIQLDDMMGHDFRPAVIARPGQEGREEEADHKLVKYLMRQRHTAPLEFVELVWYVKMPIFVARQWVRHRTAAIDEISLRYQAATPEFYLPALDRMQKQSDSMKQGSSEEIVDSPDVCRAIMQGSYDYSWRAYEQLLQEGVAKELARSVLPLATYTEWYWKNDLHNTMHFLNLRLDPHAQYEIRVYAEAMYKIMCEILPRTMQSWDELRGAR